MSSRVLPFVTALALSACTAGQVGMEDGMAADMDAGPRPCTGCVDPETGGCVRGASDVACGSGGVMCATCGDGEICGDDRACVPRGGCGPDVCPGCCMGDVCVAFERPEACGSGGDACVACERGEACVDGVCVAAASCGPDSCAGCCADDGTCQDGTTAEACGSSGGLCEACPTGWRCEDGTCRAPCEEWCGGCCDAEGVCRDGVADTACGDAGGACTDCGDGAVCTDGACVDLSCAESCAGCCLGETCLDGDLGGACGSGGAACVDCGPAFTCSRTGTCRVDPLSRWDVVAVRASFSPFAPSGALWDSGSAGRPDPYASAEASSASGTTYAGQTMRVDDTTNPIWNEDMLTDVPARDLKAGITLRVRDYDFLSRDDDVAYCLWTPDDADFGAGNLVLVCPARTSDPLTVRTEITVRLDRH